VISASFTAKLLAPLAALAVAASDAPIRVKLSDDVYTTGERARVNVKVAKDGYLVVLRVDTEGHVRVLFPVDPGDDGAVRAGKDFEIRGRGDRDAFMVTEKKGTGLVLAATADKPFNFSAFMTGQHWNNEALTPENANGDPESALLGVLDRMGDGHYEYDAVPYAVAQGGGLRPPYVGLYDPWYPPLVGPYSRSGYYAGWPWLYGPRYGYGATVVIPIRPFHGRRH